MPLIKWLIRLVSRTIRNHHMNPLASAIAYLANKYLMYYWNEMHWDTSSNGEALLLHKLADHWHDSQPVTIFDVGANKGAYTRLVEQVLPNSVIHCFEIVPATSEVLASNLKGMKNITINYFGLSDSTTHLDIVYDQANDTEAREVSSLLGEIKSIITCQVQTGDSYMNEQGIGMIDLLKIDTEGHEMAVLEGFKEAIYGGRIRVIQFEYGTTWIPPRRFLHEAYALLEPAGFHIGRLFPDGVFFKPYHRREDDHFRMGNYIAVHDSCMPIFQALNINPSKQLNRLVPY